MLAVVGALLATLVSPAQAGEVKRGGPVEVAFSDIEVPVGGTAVDLTGISKVRVIGGGERLAVTGIKAGLIGGIGLLLLGAGVASVLAARRRRVNFIA